MNKKFLLAGLALAGLFGGTTARVAAPTEQAPVAEQPIVRGNKSWPESIRQSKPVPAKPAAPIAAQRQVTARPTPVGLAFQRYFREQPQRRRVKYGCSRWLMM